ncbi:hypothetical protein [Salibacterium aidingense]|uniref:hypothetical protein n=1 Tax=Salibacterium aidingense TaxID=384933 RepID=UPI003BEA2D03
MSNYKAENKFSSLPVLVLCSFLVGFDSIVTIPLIPMIVEDANMPLDLGGLLVTVYAWLTLYQHLFLELFQTGGDAKKC